MPDSPQAIARIRSDHDYMLALIERILACCTERGRVENCAGCADSRQMICHGNIEELIRAFVETTLKHNVLEAMFMENGVPAAHRVAHIKAHNAITEQMRAIRVIFSEEGDCVIAIQGIDEVKQSLTAHFQEFDQQLETYLLAAS